MIRIKTHLTPSLSLESRQEQLVLSQQIRHMLVHNEYTHLTREDLILVVEILRSDCDRLRRELDDAKGVIR